MKEMRLYLLSVFVLLGVWAEGCQPASTLTPVSKTIIRGAILVEENGNILHKRPEWKDAYPLSIGAALDQDDLLQTGPGDNGLLVCPDLKTAVLPSNYLGGVPCQMKDGHLTRDGSYVVQPSRGNTFPMAKIPYVISPRFTFLLTAQPQLRWNPTRPVGETYQVQVLGGSVSWEVKVKDTQVIYPASAPPLEAGVPYRLIVIDSQGRSSEDEDAQIDLGFGLLSADQMQKVQGLRMQVEKMPLNHPEARELVLAEIDEVFELRADAIRELEQLASKTGAPWIHFRLGNLYYAVGLYEEAIWAFQDALSGFAAQKDTAGEAQTLLASGLAYEAMGNDPQAKSLYTESLRLFNDLGDSTQAKYVAGLLK